MSSTYVSKKRPYLKKNKALVEMSAEHQTPILVRDVRQRKAMRDLAAEFGLKIPDPLISSEMVKNIIAGKYEGTKINVIFSDDSGTFKQLFTRYGLHDIKGIPLYDFNAEPDKQFTFSVIHFIKQTNYDYDKLKIVDESSENVLFECDYSEDIVNNIPDELHERMITNLVFNKDKVIVINIGEELV